MVSSHTIYYILYTLSAYAGVPDAIMPPTTIAVLAACNKNIKHKEVIVFERVGLQSCMKAREIYYILG